MFADYNPECSTCGHTAQFCECGGFHLRGARPAPQPTAPAPAEYNPSASYGPHTCGDWEKITVKPLPGDWPGTMSLYKWYGPCHWCGAMAVAEVTRTSLLSDHTFTDPACEQHAAGWLPRA